jgi:hypothetical protein
MQTNHATGTMGLNGILGATVIRADGSRREVNLKGPRPRMEKAPLAWRARNWLRMLCTGEHLHPYVAAIGRLLPGMLPVYAELRAIVTKADGTRVDYGLVGRHLVVTAGKNFVTDAWQNLVELENMKFHGVGTGTTAAAAGDTALQTESTTALNPDSTRATGSLTEGGSANVFRTVGTVTFDNTAAITEWGLLSQAATGGGTLFDRQVFSAINVAALDSIQFTYDLTIG